MNESLIKIFESEGIERIWLQDKLDDENIPYRVDFEEYWTGTKKTEYHVKQCIFLDVRYEKSVKSFIDEYNNIDFSTQEDDELTRDFENELPQITCPACGEKIDLDYYRCPFCKHELPVAEN